MKILTYQRDTGFSEIEYAVEWGDREEQHEWLTRGGFSKCHSLDGIGEEDGPTVHVFFATEEATDPRWCAVVSISVDGSSLDYVLVATRADLLHLRMTLLPVHCLALMQRLDSVLRLADRTFEAWHGHQPDRICSGCDADGTRRQDEARQRRAAVKAATPKGA